MIEPTQRLRLGRLLDQNIESRQEKTRNKQQRSCEEQNTVYLDTTKKIIG